MPALPIRAAAALLACAGLAAEDVAAPPPPRWASTGKAGLFATSVVAGNNAESRDPAITGSTETYAYRLSLEAGLDFRSGAHSADQDLLAKYGRKKDAGQEWTEDTDEVRYDGVYRYSFAKPHFAYGSWGWESVFSGPEPEHAPFSPGQVKAAVGYGQLYEGFWPKTAKLEARIGVAARKRYGSGLADADKDAEMGIELFVRHEHVLDERLRYFAQYEAFSEFADPGHVTNLLTAGLTAQLSRFLTAELGLRAYYESRPEDAARGATGYDEASLRQDTLLGLVYTW
jgi:hypothetical protein